MYLVNRQCTCGRKYSHDSDEADLGMCDVCLDEELERQDPDE